MTFPYTSILNIHRGVDKGGNGDEGSVRGWQTLSALSRAFREALKEW